MKILNLKLRNLKLRNLKLRDLKLRDLFLGVCLSVCGTAIAQPHLGYHSDNYAGIHNITFQPADIVDSRYLVDINLVGFQFAAGNDYLAMNSNALREAGSFGASNFKQKYITENLNGRAKNVYLATNMLLPSFMISLGKNSFAFQSNFHNAVNVEGVSEKLAYMSYRELKTPELWKTPYDNQNLAIQAMGWVDYGLSYGREVYNKGQHYIKAAGTVKLLQGLYSAQLYSKNANVVFKNADTLDINNTDFSYGRSSNFEKNVNGYTYDFVGKAAIGGDIGVVYEWRKTPETYTYSMDGRDDLPYDDRNKYKLKVGAAVCNIGAIPFTRSTSSGSFYANKKNVSINDFSVSSVGKLDSAFNTDFVSKKDQGSTYQQSLPLAVNLSADYNIWKGLYLNAAASLSPQKELEIAKTHSINNYSLTARYEMKWFSAWLPISYDALQNFHVGLGMRAGPLTIGLNDITPFITEKKMYDIGFYTMLRIPIYKNHKRDQDGDKVSDKLDKCPKEPGLLANKGCPETKPTDNKGGDKDGDGVLDKDDKCPDEKGLAVLKGCPDGDKDDDGILDFDDKCPDVKGFADTEGCPHLEQEEIEMINTAFKNLGFKRTSDEITPESYISLDKLAELMVKKPNYILEINGHTDNAGSPVGNMALSVRRAEAVKKYLVSKNIKEDRITTHGYGITRPLNDNKTEEERAKNRRVELIIKSR